MFDVKLIGNYYKLYLILMFNFVFNRKKRKSGEIITYITYNNSYFFLFFIKR